MKILIEDNEYLENIFNTLTERYSNVKKCKKENISRLKVKYDIYLLYCDIDAHVSDFNIFKVEQPKIIFLSAAINVDQIHEFASNVLCKDYIYVYSENVSRRIEENIYSIERSNNEEFLNDINCMYNY